MRPAILDRGQGLPQRIALTVMGWVTRTEPDPVAKVCMYRPELFGRPWLTWAPDLMRGRSEWTPGEREVIAAFVSQLNDCPFCVGVHAGIADRRDAGPSDPIAWWRHGKAPAHLAAIFGMLEKVTLTPDNVGPDDMTRAREAGLSHAAITDALYVCYFFNVINRMANAFDFRWETDADRRKLAAGLDRIGYRVPKFLLR
jgi:uncharacterized peroxidase-related enzyme